MSKLAVYAKLNDITEEPHDGFQKGFSRLSKAGYGEKLLTDPAIVDDFTIGFYDADGADGTTGEFSIVFTVLDSQPTAKMEIFDDAFHALACMPELIIRLAQHDPRRGSKETLTPDLLEEILLELGFVNRTKTVVFT